MNDVDDDDDDDLTLASLELFHMKPSGIHPWHLPAPNLGHGMLVSATVLSSTTKPIYALKDGSNVIITSARLSWKLALFFVLQQMWAPW